MSNIITFVIFNENFGLYCGKQMESKYEQGKRLIRILSLGIWARDTVVKPEVVLVHHSMGRLEMICYICLERTESRKICKSVDQATWANDAVIL